MHICCDWGENRMISEPSRVRQESSLFPLEVHTWNSELHGYNPNGSATVQDLEARKASTFQGHLPESVRDRDGRRGSENATSHVKYHDKKWWVLCKEAAKIEAVVLAQHLQFHGAKDHLKPSEQLLHACCFRSMAHMCPDG
eukprot:1899508-Amphidinium_carterae.1